MKRGLINESRIWSPQKATVYLIDVPRCEEVKVDYQFETKNRKTGSKSIIKSLKAGDCKEPTENSPVEDEISTEKPETLTDNLYIAAAAGGGGLVLISLIGIPVFIIYKKKKTGIQD